MTASKNAARVAVKAAACPDAAAKHKPQDVLDCMAMGLPREQWAEALEGESRQQMQKACIQGVDASMLRHQVVVQALMQSESLLETLLRLTPSGPEHAAQKTLLKRLTALNTAAMGGVLDDGEPVEDLQLIVEARE